MSYSPQPHQSPHSNEVGIVAGTPIHDSDFSPYRTSPKSNNNNNISTSNIPTPNPNYAPNFFHSNGSTTTIEPNRHSSTANFVNEVGTVVEEVYPAESYAVPQSRGINGTSTLTEGITPLEKGEGGNYQAQRPVQSQAEWEESQQPRMNLPQQYDYARRASEATYPYDRNTTNGPTPVTADSPVPPRPGSADGYFYVAPTTTIASHLAIPPERDAPLYYNYGGYSSQPTYNHPGFNGTYSAPGSTQTINSDLPSLATANSALDSTFNSNAARTSPGSAALIAPVYEREGANTDERNYKCDQCPHAFHRNHDLKRHKRIHLEIKPYPCHWCSKRFTRKDALKRHLLVKQHPAAPPQDNEILPPPTTTTTKKPKKMTKAAAAAAAAATAAASIFNADSIAPFGEDSSRRSSLGEGSHHSNNIDEIEEDQDYKPAVKGDLVLSPQYAPPPPSRVNGSPTLATSIIPSLGGDISITSVALPTRALSSRTKRGTGAPQYEYSDALDEEEEEEERLDREREVNRERQKVRERELEEEMEREEQQEQTRHQIFQQQQHHQQIQAQQAHHHQQHQLYQQQFQQSQEHLQHYPPPLHPQHSSHSVNNSNNNDSQYQQSHHQIHQQQQQPQYQAYYP